jgi:cell cycle sensor histidine kinase DivJ
MSAESLLTIVNDILDFSKIEAGKLQLEIVDFSVHQLVDEVADLMEDAVRRKQLHLTSSVDPAIPALVRGDPGRLRQILTNLVANAIKFTERGGSVTVSAAVEGSRLMLSVTDTGVGIAAEDLARIGDPFFQAGKTYQRKHEGTGLGLSIVKGLVALHNGEMNVQSTVGEGTTIAVALPLDFAPLLTPSNNVAPLKPALRSGSQDQVHQVKKRA